VENDPLTVRFTVFADFDKYKSGIYSHQTGANEGGHAVRLMGYGQEMVNGTNTNYWLVANSWNTTWGEGGYFRIKHGECGIDDYAVGGIPK